MITKFLVRLAAESPVDINPLPKPSADSSSIYNILTIVFGIVGAVSVLMVVIGGLRYITAQGDSSQLSKAKGTIIYALIGLMVSISAVAIVTFVLGKVA